MRTWTRSTGREQMALARKVALGEMGVMTVGALLILTLALRAYQTAAAERLGDARPGGRGQPACSCS